MNIQNITKQKLSQKVTITTLLILLVVIILSSALYYKKVAGDLSVNDMNLTPIIAKVQDGVAEVNYFATSSNAQILARYPKGDKLAADYVYSQIGKFLEEVGENTSGSSAPNQFVAPFSTSSSSDTKSVIFKIYKFSGGAHGNQYSHVINYDKDNNVIEVKNLLTRYDMNKITKVVQEELMKEYYDILKSEGQITGISADNFYKSEEGLGALTRIKEGSAATSTNYDMAWLDGENLNIYISKYQAWPYAYGDYTVSIPTPQIKK